MWLPLAAITVTALCVVRISGDTVRQPMEVDARQENVQQDIIGAEKDPAKKSTGDSPSRGILPVEENSKPKGVSSRYRAALMRRMTAEGHGMPSGKGMMYRLADQMVSFVKSRLHDGDVLERMVEDIPDTADHPEPQRKLQNIREMIKHNWLNNVLKDTKRED